MQLKFKPYERSVKLGRKMLWFETKFALKNLLHSLQTDGINASPQRLII
jgi:hypothetical protein